MGETTGSEKVCSVEGCLAGVQARGWCTAHYHRWRKYGEVTEAPVRGRPIEPEIADRLADLASSGSSDGEIAAALGLLTSQVYRERHSRGIPSQWKQEKKHNGASKCTCDRCRRARREKSRKRRGLGFVPANAVHGVAHTATNYGCRCEPCLTAVAARNAADLNRRAAETRPGATHHGEEWTGPQLEIAARPDLTATQAARMLGRTADAVMAARKKIRRDPRTSQVAGIP